MRYSIAQLNQMSQSDFVEQLGAVFEETPTIAQHVWEQRPFEDVDDLHQKMTAIVKAMSQPDQLRLIRAHPDLGSKAKMATASVQEQSGAGLDQLSSQDYARFRSLNQAYKDKFGFPFIIAVRNHSKSSILNAFERRLKNSLSVEITQALIEISTIAHFRLISLIELSS